MALPGMLIVEPDSQIRESLAAYLGSWFEVRQAEGAREATTALEERAADVVVAEIELKDGYGPALLSEIRSRWPDTSIAVLYYYTHATQNLMPILERVADVCIQKPFDLDKVAQTLRDLGPRGSGHDRSPRA